MPALFQKVLIANRGEIALRVLHCLSRLGISSVAVYHHSDRHSPVVRLADEAVALTGTSPSAAYLDIEQIVAVCKAHDVDAVHPCYGFLSENAKFAAALNAAGITFIGPDVQAIDLMGDKIRSREFVEQHGFPVPPSVSLDPADTDVVAAVAGMKFPLVVKASAGGGGKGMSIVRSESELASTLKIAASEAEKYFGDARVYVERYFESARHIEVQVFGDGDNVVHLFERECSVQRRFQKVIEESPSPALTPDKRDEICTAAVGIAQAADYRNAGTVEFLYTPEGEFFFLEMNTRIQVEHPVTELVTGVDLVEWQLRVASGQALPLSQQQITQSGHAIECRVCAEDPDSEFMPETGRVLYLREPDGDGVRFDSGLYAGQSITSAFDPMLAKLVVHAADRHAAMDKAVSALQQTVILGVVTNVDYMTRILQHPVFQRGAIDTGFVSEYAEDLTPQPMTADDRNALLVAAMLSDREVQHMLETTPQPYAAIGKWMN